MSQQRSSTWKVPVRVYSCRSRGFEPFVPANLLKHLSRDSGDPGMGWDERTSRRNRSALLYSVIYLRLLCASLTFSLMVLEWGGALEVDTDRHKVSSSWPHPRISPKVTNGFPSFWEGVPVSMLVPLVFG